MLDLDAVSYAIDGKTVLHPLSLSLGRGEVVGLIGHNGSGKSTLMKLVARHLSPSQGMVRLAGRDVSRWSAQDFAREVAYMPQHLAPAGGMTVEELVRLGRYPWHGALGRFSASDQQHVDAALDVTGVRAMAGRLVDSLSGGERQRVWLALLLAQKSGLLLLDEPIAALDIAHQIATLELVRSVSRSLGLGVLIILHDLNLAVRYCDRLVVLKNGHLQADETARQVLHSGILQQVYGVPMHIVPHPATDQPCLLVG